MIYAVGGFSPEAGISDAVFVYDPKQNTWSSAPSMTTPRESPGIVQLAGKIYAIGGEAAFQVLRSDESFDQQTNKWNDFDVIYSRRTTVRHRRFYFVKQS